MSTRAVIQGVSIPRPAIPQAGELNGQGISPEGTVKGITEKNFVPQDATLKAANQSLQQIGSQIVRSNVNIGRNVDVMG